MFIHRDDGGGIALKVLKRVQKGWGHGSVRHPQRWQLDLYDHSDDAG